MAVLLLAVTIAGYYAYRNGERASERLAQLRGQDLLQQADQLKSNGKVAEALAKLQEADQVVPRPDFNLKAASEDVLRQKAIQLVKEGEKLARNHDLTGAAAKYQAALDLNPPLDTLVYVRVPAGEFTMGSDATADKYAKNYEKPQHNVTLREFWIQRTEVSNAQYGACVQVGACTKPDNTRWEKAQLQNWPVTDVSWTQAISYTQWMGGRLPSEAEWEKACRGTEARIYPWGNEAPTRALANSNFNEGTLTDVGSYPNGKSPYGLVDMAGNVFEWTNSKYRDYPYKTEAGREELTGDDTRSLRGGAFIFGDSDVRCAYRNKDTPDYRILYVGFRVASPGF